MITRVLIAPGRGAIVMFILGSLIYRFALDSYMRASLPPEAAKLMKETPNLILLFAADLAMAWMPAFIFERWASIKTFVSGATAGLLIALPMMIGV